MLNGKNSSWIGHFLKKQSINKLYKESEHRIITEYLGAFIAWQSNSLERSTFIIKSDSLNGSNVK